MAMSLIKYAEHLDGRGDPKPLGPDPQPFGSVKPHAPPLGVKAVVYGGHGTLFLLPDPDQPLLPADPVMRRIALDKTVQEFKMWASMSRKPGEPADYMAGAVDQLADRLRMSHTNAQRTELPHEIVWRAWVDRLLQKEYAYDAGVMGDLDDLSAKISLFYLRACQGLTVPDKTLTALKKLHKTGVKVGVHANGQRATPLLLLRELTAQGAVGGLADVFHPALCLWSADIGVRKETERGFAALADALQAQGVAPEEAVYVGCDMDKEIAPAKRRGLKTALLLVDKASARVKPEQLKDPRLKPDALLTAAEQVPLLATARG